MTTVVACQPVNHNRCRYLNLFFFGLLLMVLWGFPTFSRDYFQIE